MKITININGRLRNGYEFKKFPSSWFMVKTKNGLNPNAKLFEDKFIYIGMPFISIYADWKF